jgi:H2-forming N5,N10-methylenetetrahydromethanopterin dehydrogenase-like enzyme
MDEEEQQEAIQRVLDAMMTCGWTSMHAFEEGNMGVRFTDLGAETMNRLRQLFELLGGTEISPELITAVVCLVVKD